MIRSKAACWLLITLSVALVLWIRLLPRSLPSLEKSVKSHFTFSGEDGSEHVYLGDLDSYLWLRHARTLLRTGSPCDAIVNGDCRDRLTNAPAGASSIYARSLHVVAIARLHQVVTAFAPDVPLQVTSFYVPVIVGCLGVLPAFFIARRLAPSFVAGPFAVLLTGLQPNVIARTFGSDADIWNVVLPLFALWALLAAVSAKTWRSRVLMASLAAGCVAMQAWAWRGWLFVYAALVLSLVGLALIGTTSDLRRHRTLRNWRGREAGRLVIVALVFYAVAGLLTSLVDVDRPYLTIPATVIDAVLPAASSAPASRGAADLEWPSAFSDVAELRPMALQNTANAMGHAMLVCGLVGLLLLFLPRRWGRRHVALFVAGTGWYTVSVFAIEPDRLAAMAMLAAPLGVALLLGDANDDDAGRRLAAFSLAAWFLGAIYLAHNGARYLLLLAPPLGIACAVLAGSLQVTVVRLVHDTARWYRLTVTAVLAIVLAMAFINPTMWAYRVASGAIPAMHDAWWDTLVRLRQRSPPDAIVHTWWDYGHWVTYVAERRVNNDGSSLSTHIPFWTARALAAPTEKESLGILRMLSCGSDATPLPEGGNGAYGKLLATVRDPAIAYELLNDIIVLDTSAADGYLAQRGLAALARASVLRSSHCTPPDSYLVVTSAMTARRRSWLSLGLRDPRQSDTIATTSSMAAAGLRATDERATDLAFLPQWIPCTVAGDGPAVRCHIRNPIVPGAGSLDTFDYDPASPQNGRLRGRPGETSESGAAPAAVVIAGEREIRNITSEESVFAEIGVLVDVPNQRILLGAPSFLGSTFVRLMYLDEEYSPYFRRFDERRTASERVVTWQIDWGRD